MLHIQALDLFTVSTHLHILDMLSKHFIPHRHFIPSILKGPQLLSCFPFAPALCHFTFHTLYGLSMVKYWSPMQYSSYHFCVVLLASPLGQAEYLTCNSKPTGPGSHQCGPVAVGVRSTGRGGYWFRPAPLFLQCASALALSQPLYNSLDGMWSVKQSFSPHEKTLYIDKLLSKGASMYGTPRQVMNFRLHIYCTRGRRCVRNKSTGNFYESSQN